MKKQIAVLSVTALLLSGCAADTSKIDSLAKKDSSSFVSMKDITSDSSSSAVTQPPTETQPETPAETQPSDSGELDVDLTQMDSNMVYAQVFDMVTDPSRYLGKRIKAKGTFAHTEANGKHYFAVFMSDAAACCQQGLEFELTGEHSYPEDYPELDSEIIVEGIFNTYKEGNNTYCQLKDATMTTLA